MLRRFVRSAPQLAGSPTTWYQLVSLGTGSFILMAKRRRPVLTLELLEDRIVPSTFSRLADVDGYATDSNLDGIFESVDTTSTTLRTTNYAGYGLPENRSILEFNVSSLNPTVTVNSATLSFWINTISYNGSSPGVDVNFYGYSGDGVVSTDDATATTTLVGQLLDDSAVGVLSVNLDPQFVQSQLGSGYLGI